MNALGDLEWLPGEAYALVVTHAEELLVDEEPDALNTFLRIIETVASTWASPIAEGERWDRAAVPFHCVLQARRDGESHKDLRSLDESHRSYSTNSTASRRQPCHYLG